MSRQLAMLTLLLAGCSDHLVGLSGAPTPLARIQVQVEGDLAPLRPPGTENETPQLRVALVWGAQWLNEPFCFLPPESSEADLLIQAGCRDSLGFAPARVAANVAVEVGVPATLDLFDLPAADVMVGDVTARIAYGSLIVYDDRDGSGTLELRRPSRDGPEGPPPPDGGPVVDSKDIVYGASFVSMALPDRRLAFREGGFLTAAAFYPRAGCEPPPPGFSLLSAGGFSLDEARAAAILGRLPEEDPATCATSTLDQAVVTIALTRPADVREVACRVRRTDGSVRYNEPPGDASVLTGRTWACVGFPTLGSDPVPGQQLVIAAGADESCMGLTHYALKSCEEDPGCATPQWDRTASPPDWWPCQVQPAP